MSLQYDLISCNEKKNVREGLYDLKKKKKTHTSSMKDNYIDPIYVVSETIDRMSQKLGVALLEIGLMHRDTT